MKVLIEIELEDVSVRFRMELAKVSRDADILDKLSNDEYVGIRKNVAINYRTSSETLAKLAKDENWEVRKEVARNVHTLPETLKELSKDTNKEVLKRVALNARTPVETLTELSYNIELEKYIRKNPMTPEKIRKELQEKNYLY